MPHAGTLLHWSRKGLDFTRPWIFMRSKDTYGVRDDLVKFRSVHCLQCFSISREQKSTLNHITGSLTGKWSPCPPRPPSAAEVSKSRQKQSNRMISRGARSWMLEQSISALTTRIRALHAFPCDRPSDRLLSLCSTLLVLLQSLLVLPLRFHWRRNGASE